MSALIALKVHDSALIPREFSSFISVKYFRNFHTDEIPIKIHGLGFLLKNLGWGLAYFIDYNSSLETSTSFEIFKCVMIFKTQNSEEYKFQRKSRSYGFTGRRENSVVIRPSRVRILKFSSEVNGANP